MRGSRVRRIASFARDQQCRYIQRLAVADAEGFIRRLRGFGVIQPA